MILKIYKLGEIYKIYNVNDIDDLDELFKSFPMTLEIAKNSFTLTDVLHNIANYFSNMSAWTAYVEDPWTEAKHASDDEEEYEKLQKDVGRVTFPNILPKETRMDQEVASFPASGKNTYIKKQIAAKLKVQDTDIPDIIQHYYSDEDKGGTANTKDGTYQFKNIHAGRYISEHEGFHGLINKLSNHLGIKKSYIYDRMNLLIPQKIQNHLRNGLLKRNYNNKYDQDSELIPALRDALVNPKFRNQIFDNKIDQKVMSEMKQVFKNIKHFANNATVDDFKSKTPDPQDLEKTKKELKNKGIHITGNINKSAMLHKDFFKYKKYRYRHNNHIQKSLTDISSSVRTEGRAFVSLDGDNIGASVERAAMSDDLSTIIRQSQKIHDGAMVIAKWAKEHDGDLYISGGDDVAFTMPKKYIPLLPDLKDLYHENTGFTVTIGVGNTISQAGRAMLYGKLHGKDQVNVFTEEVNEYLKRVSKKISPEEKLREEGLIKSNTGKLFRKIVRKIKGTEVPKTGIPHVASIAVVDGDKLLMGKRNDNGKWTLPGGHLEPGENPKEGAIRELKEETNIKPRYIFKLGSRKITCEDGKDRVIHVFGALGEYKPSSKNDPDKEVKKWNWINTKEDLTDDIMNNLHSPKNVTLNLLGLQEE